MRRGGIFTATTRLITHHISKGETIASSLKDRLDYGKDPDKTQDGQLISSYECDHQTADAEFLLSRAKYKAVTGREQKREADVLCYQIRQSFAPGEITPEEANRVGYETAMRWTKGKHAFLLLLIQIKNISTITFITILFHWTTPGNSGTSGDRLGLSGGFPTGYVWKMIYRLSSIRNFTARAVSCTMASGLGSGPRLPSRGYGLPSLRL